MQSLRVLGLIPARGGSKGVPGKNTRLLAGKSLIERAFDCARASDILDRIIISTDEPTIADHARALGLDVPFMRPNRWASDTSPMIDVAIHACDALRAKEGYQADALLLLQPTSPLRKPSHIRRAIRMLQDNDSVCSVVPLPKDLCPHYLMKIRDDGYLDYFMSDGPKYTRRQDVPQAYKRDGTIFLTRTSVIIEQRSFYGSRSLPMLIDLSESLNIDSPDEWAVAETILSAQAA